MQTQPQTNKVAMQASPALQRIIEEVRNKEINGIYGSYDRTHNRHNRGQ